MQKVIKKYLDLANESGWVYYPNFPLEIFPHLDKFELLKDIDPVQNSKHVLLNQSGQYREMVMEVIFMAGKVPVVLTVYFQEDQTVNLPHMYMQPERFYHQVGAYLGMQDIDFTEFPDFSKNYRLKGDHVRDIHNLFTDQVKGFFSYEKGWIIEINNHQCMLYKEDKQMDNKMIKPFIQAAQTIVALFKNQISL